MTTEVLDFRAFCRGEIIILNQKETRRKRLVYRTVVRMGVLTLVLVSTHPLSTDVVTAFADSSATAVHAAAGHSWDNLINGLLHLLDPVAKIFGLIAGIAIMTGNGKIGLERLFWLSLGYITARKVEIWIDFLNTL